VTAGQDGYRDLLSYIVSNAVAGELVAVANYTDLAGLVEDEASRLECLGQAEEESKHVRMLAGVGKKVGYDVQQRIIEPQWQNVRKHFQAAVKKRDITACLLVQDLMTETMAIVLYETLSNPRAIDEKTAEIARLILADEIEHLGIGTRRLQSRLQADPEQTEDALVWAHHRVMPELFSMVGTSCHFLCDELSLDCGSLDPSHLEVDLDTLRILAVERYTEALDLVGFSPRTSSSLVASMSAYGGMSSLGVGMAGRSGPACC
jgi:fatty aldehyde decarbonylase